MIFKHPFTAIVAGPSGSGKTVFTAKLIEHSSQMIDPPPQKILWCYGAHQKFFNEMKNTQNNCKKGSQVIKENEIRGAYAEMRQCFITYTSTSVEERRGKCPPK